MRTGEVLLTTFLIFSLTSRWEVLTYCRAQKRLRLLSTYAAAALRTRLLGPSSSRLLYDTMYMYRHRRPTGAAAVHIQKTSAIYQALFCKTGTNVRSMYEKYMCRIIASHALLPHAGRRGKYFLRSEIKSALIFFVCISATTAAAVVALKEASLRKSLRFKVIFINMKIAWLCALFIPERRKCWEESQEL